MIGQVSPHGLADRAWSILFNVLIIALYVSQVSHGIDGMFPHHTCSQQ
jgi:hypothetical protein